MNRHPHDLPCDEALDLLEAYLDGDLASHEAARLGSHLEGCAACAAEHELAMRIQRELRALPELDCPPAVLERVQKAGRGEVVAFPPRRRAAGLRIAAAAAMLALALGGGALFLNLQKPSDPPSPEEIAQATRDAKLALAYIGQVTRRTSLDLRDDVLRKRLIAPATRDVSGRQAKEF